jgi:branched-chain amino acid transport system permease protein
MLLVSKCHFLGHKKLLGLILCIVLFALPFLLDQYLGRAWVRIIDFALLFSLLALGLNIVVGYAGLLDLGYIAFFAVGAYCYGLLCSPQFGLHWPFWFVLPLGALLAGLFGIVLGAPTLKLRGDYLAIVTLGFGEIIRIFLNNLNHPVNITNGAQGITLIDPLQWQSISLAQTIHWGGIEIAPVHYYYFVFLFCTMFMLVVSSRLERSRIGRAWMAIREDEVAAACMGLNTRNIKLTAFAMGASFGGLAGGLFAAFQGFISPESFTLTDSIMVLCMVVLGGMGHVSGVVLGAILLSVLPEILRYAGPLQMTLLHRVWVDPSDLRMLLFGLALIVMMLLRPKGLWPAKHGASTNAPSENTEPPAKNAQHG